MKNIAAVVLAAGRGVRMKSKAPKALCELSGRPMVEFLIDIAKNCSIENIVVIGGYKIGLLRKRLSGHKLHIIEQKKLLGSADAVKRSEGYFKRFKGTLVVLYADTPLIKAATLKGVIRLHAASKADVTLLTAVTDDPKEYGRVLRDEKNRICDIAEHTDIKDKLAKAAKDAPRSLCEINVGAYCFDSGKLFEGLRHIKKNRIKKEFYLTDIMPYFYKKGYSINSYVTTDGTEALGINRVEDLIEAEDILRKRTIARLLQEGIKIKSPENVYIQEGAKIAQDTIINPFVVIERDVIIGSGCRVGPFAHLRRGTVLKDGSEIGNFVEVVRSSVGVGSKAKHHSYLGDALVGKGVNIGAGTITANYDGKKKNRTVINDGAFIGSGTTIVAPVKIGRGAVTGAGSVVVKGKDVAPHTVVVGVPAKPLKILKRSS
jgi:bifunctional UDP-N-acetylglucosamine pyrophosphorylase/glucosamine-1-phosphate N-acetyltransferase